MQEAVNTLAERRAPITRNSSFSTVDSSVAAADAIQQYIDYKNSLVVKPTVAPNIPTNVKVENSDNINIVYNFYGGNKPLNASKAQPSRKNSFSSIFSENFEKVKRKICCWRLNKRRKIILVVVLLIIAIISSVIPITTYQLMKNNPSDDNFETTSEITTSSSSTTLPNQITTPTTSQTTSGSITTDETTEPTEITVPSEPIEPVKIVTRNEWGANPPRSSSIKSLTSPIERIIIGHTGGQICINQNDCINAVKTLQIQDSSLDDIPYNFLIGGDGNVYEGRGFDYEGQHTKNKDATEYNSIGICIAFIGNYQSTSPSAGQIEVLKSFIEHFTESGMISKDHIIVSQDDLRYSATNALSLNNIVKTLENYRQLYKIYRREEWSARSLASGPNLYNETMKWLLIGHTVTPLCDDLTACKARGRQLQEYSIDTRGFKDILYNIFFGGDGYAFEGRGWDYTASHHTGLNYISIGVGVIGDFENVAPSSAILNAMQKVFDDAKALGKLKENYKIFGRSDFDGPGPGAAFMNIIKSWCNYGNRTSSC